MFFWGTFVAYAQKLPEKGVPALRNFNPVQYQNEGKIWDIRSAPCGIVYMAADGGLLEYDGKNWNSYKGSDGITRSVLPVNDSLIYTGSDLDFGVWKRNQLQEFEYTSLYPFREDVGDVYEEFWDVHQWRGNIVFVSSQNIYLYNASKLTQIAAPNKFAGSFATAGALYFVDEKLGLFTLNGPSLKPVFNYPRGVNLQISGIYQNAQGLVIVTKSAGLYLYASGRLMPLESPLSQSLKIAKVFSFEPVDDTHLAFGTVLKGLYITDLSGKILHHINKYKGFPNNTVLSLHYTPSGKLWVGTDYGASVLDLDKNLTYFYDYRGDFGTGYTALLKDDVFYLGTNQGLYSTKWESLDNNSDFSRFQLIPGTEGQVWTLENIDGNVLMGHDQGLFVLNGNTIQQISDRSGVWTIVPYGNYLLTGNYNGISIFSKNGNTWNFLKKMELIQGSCNQVLFENDHILWVNIPNFGVIRAVLNADLYPTERLIFYQKSFEGNNPCLIQKQDQILLVTDQSQYKFDTVAEKFIPAVEVIAYPKVDALLPGVYQPRALRHDYEYFPVFNGFALRYLLFNDQKKTANYAIVIREMKAFNNEREMFFQPGATISMRLNNLRIGCIVPNQDNVLYQYKLNGAGEWSPWSPDNVFEFFGLRHGSYALTIRANVEGEITAGKTIAFRIDTPWYQSWYAYLFYVLCVGLLFYVIRKWQKLSLQKQKKQLLLKEQASLRQLAEKHREEIIRLEQEQFQKEYDQLKLQLKNKTVELANKAKDSEHKSRLLLTLKEKLDDVQHNPAKSKMRWNEMQVLLDSYLNVEDKTFEIQIDELHQEFFKKLKDKFPTLSSNDLRLCAYLKIGLNTKEIADVLNILPSSAFITRSRLRKKLNLDADEDLYDFLNSI